MVSTNQDQNEVNGLHCLRFAFYASFIGFHAKSSSRCENPKRQAAFIIISPCLQISKLSHRKVRSFAQDRSLVAELGSEPVSVS